LLAAACLQEGMRRHKEPVSQQTVRHGPLLVRFIFESFTPSNVISFTPHAFSDPYGSYQSRDVSHFKKSNAILQQGKPIGEEGPPSLSFASPGATSFVGEVYYNEGEGSSAKMSFKDEAVAQMQASPATIAQLKPQLDFEQCHKPKRFFGRGKQNILLESIVVCVFGLFLLRETAKTSAWLDLSD
jgi:hypothetical protein